MDMTRYQQKSEKSAHNSSTEIATYVLINNTLSSLNNKLLVDSLFCELQNLFDCLNRETLLSKMRF